MKKFGPILLSLIIATSIAISRKSIPNNNSTSIESTWNTYTKNSNHEIIEYKTTSQELDSAHVPEVQSRSIASVSERQKREKIINANHFLQREDRVLIGEIQKKDYQDENVELSMINKINPHWKEILGQEMLRFQNVDAKVMIKEEFPIIQIQKGEGQYVEQVIITYLYSDGKIESFRALIDSESGKILETWDKTIRENFNSSKHSEKAALTLPSQNESGIITR